MAQDDQTAFCFLPSICPSLQDWSMQCRALSYTEKAYLVISVWSKGHFFLAGSWLRQDLHTVCPHAKLMGRWLASSNMWQQMGQERNSVHCGCWIGMMTTYNESCSFHLSYVLLVKRSEFGVLCYLMPPGLRKDIRCHVWPKSSKQCKSLLNQLGISWSELNYFRFTGWQVLSA